MKKLLVGLSLALASLVACAGNVVATDGSPWVVADGSRLLTLF